MEAAYSGKHRAYHTTRHIDECPEEVECALWFHDAIYEPMSSSNEERSAAWAVEFFQGVGVRKEGAERIQSHIMATRHVGLAEDNDGRLVVDIDLAILGPDAARYVEFERDVRREYKWVPGMIYRKKAGGDFAVVLGSGQDLSLGSGV